VTTPEADGGWVRTFDRSSSRSPAVWWCIEGLLGASIAGGIVLFSYSMLADLTARLGLLSSTAIAFLVILAWVSVWSAIAATRDHVRRRPETSRDR
jgi:high-affinity Fe2+/Pb2+ permease